MFLFVKYPRVAITGSDTSAITFDMPGNFRNFSALAPCEISNVFKQAMDRDEKQFM